MQMAMKKRIYLFCNEQYGEAYLRVLQAAAGKWSNFDCYVVFSVPGRDDGCLSICVNMIRRLRKSIVYRAHNLPVRSLKVITVADVNRADFYEIVPIGSIGFVAGFNQIFKKPIIDRFSSFINFHPSLLPYYRGAIPSYWVIKNNETITGFTAHVVSEQVDAGEIIYQELVEINQDISEVELDRKIAVAGSFYFDECLKAIGAGKSFRRKSICTQYSKLVDYVSAVRE